MSRGKFITVEGIDGAGKSTQLEVIGALLKDRDINFISTREPGGTPLGEQLRELLLNKKELNIGATAELLMIYTARAQHISKIIRPALDKGVWVLSDRFLDSTYAYQGGGRNLIPEMIDRLKSIVHPDIDPDLTLLFDVEVEIGLSRVDQRSNHRDIFEEQNLEFKNRVRNNYLALANANPARIHIVDARKPIEHVKKRVTQILHQFLNDA